MPENLFIVRVIPKKYLRFLRTSIEFDTMKSSCPRFLVIPSTQRPILVSISNVDDLFHYDRGGRKADLPLHFRKEA